MSRSSLPFIVHMMMKANVVFAIGIWYIIASKSVQVQAGTACLTVKYGGCPPPEQLINPGRSACTVNGQCSGIRLCCPSKFPGRKYCSDPRGARTGSCPEGGVNATSAAQCYKDADCSYNRKCCPDSKNECIGRCSNPAPGSCYNILKRGFCPTPPSPVINPKDCSDDEGCPGNQVCCMDTQLAKKRCSNPYTNKMGTCPAPNDLANHNANLRGSCFVDSDCSGASRKCCEQDSCTFRCVDAIISSGSTTVEPTTTGEPTTTVDSSGG